jgi:hypothetical protein
MDDSEPATPDETPSPRALSNSMPEPSASPTMAEPPSQLRARRLFASRKSRWIAVVALAGSGNRSLRRSGHLVLGEPSLPISHKRAARVGQRRCERSRIRRRIQRPVRAGLRGSIRYRGQGVRFELHHDDLSGSGCHRR